MANQLGMDKALAIKQLRQSGMSQQAITTALGISRGAVVRHLAGLSSNGTGAPIGKAPTGSEAPNGTEAPTGSDAPPAATSPGSRSRCEPYREIQLRVDWHHIEEPSVIAHTVIASRIDRVKRIEQHVVPTFHYEPCDGLLQSCRLREQWANIRFVNVVNAPYFDVSHVLAITFELLLWIRK